MADAELKQAVEEYARDNRRFVKDAVSTYDRLTALGRASLSARADSVTVQKARRR